MDHRRFNKRKGRADAEAASPDGLLTPQEFYEQSISQSHLERQEEEEEPSGSGGDQPTAGNKRAQVPF